MISKKPYLLHAYYDWISDNNWTPYLLVNAEYPNVNVPNQYVRNGRIVLDISSIACRGLEMNSSGVRFSARFSGQLWQIQLPLAAVLAIYAKENNQGMTFQSEPEFENSELAQQSEPQTPKKPFLTVIHNDDNNKK